MGGIMLPVVLLAGGLGTRLREETEDKPKPMVEIGGKPMLWHIMRYYSSFGFNEFVVCLGYKGDIIKNFFLNYRSNQGSITVNLKDGAFKKHDDVGQDPWIIHLIETGQNTMTGGRIKRAAQFLGPRRFMATYGDGLSNVDLTKLLAYHMREKRKATITAVRPPARFGGLEIDGGAVTAFTEKPQVGEGWINGGFMVFEPEIVDYIAADSTMLEREPLENLASQGQLSAFKHEEFWQCMDTVRDLSHLRDIWNSGDAPWLNATNKPAVE